MKTPKTAQPLRFGLVGAGRVAQAYAQAFSELTLGRVAAVADLRHEAARSLAEQLGCPCYADHRQLLEDGGCEAVLVLTPPATHPEICLDAIERGLPVLCEKPLATDLAAARRMVAAAEAAGVLLSMASKFRYTEDVIRARSILASGILGEIILLQNAFTSRVDMAGRWNADPRVSGGGVLIDNGTHSVDLARYFLGPIDKVQAVEGKRVQGLEVEDTARLELESRGGVMASIDLSWSLDKHLESFLDIYGSEGTVKVGWQVSRYRQTGSSDWVVFGQGYSKIQAFHRQLESFCRAVRGEEAPRVTAIDALASVEVIEAAYTSLRANHWVPVGRPEDRPRAAQA